MQRGAIHFAQAPRARGQLAHANCNAVNDLLAELPLHRPLQHRLEQKGKRWRGLRHIAGTVKSRLTRRVNADGQPPVELMRYRFARFRHTLPSFDLSWSRCGMTRYSDTGCSAEIKSAMRQSQLAVTCATVGSRYSPKKLMAVDRTPERSLSLLLRTSRAAEATTGCGVSPRCFVCIIRCSVVSKAQAGSERKLATPRSVLSRPA